MWFKRRKKSEQDQALSQSLKSLQSLLNESDRREPSLDADRGNDPDDTSDDVPAARTPEALKPRAARTPGGPDAGPREPTPPDSASRWRDLSLSFDAEPVAPPRPRRRPGPAADPEAPAGAALQEDTEDEVEAVVDEALPVEPEPDEDDVVEPEAVELETAGPDSTEPTLEAASSEPDEQAMETPAPQRAGEADEPPALEPHEADEVQQAAPRLSAAPVDFDSFSGPAPADEADDTERESVEPAMTDALEVEPAGDGDLEDEGVVMDEPSLPSFQPDEGEVPSGSHGPSGAGDSTEDQLHLELELEPDAADDIPTLTEAVYVPDPAPEPPAPADVEPVESQLTKPPDDTAPERGSVEWCVEQLRTRLQLMEIDPLSPEQEAELRDTLSELLDELSYPDTGH